jgi:hypothetical protein
MVPSPTLPASASAPLTGAAPRPSPEGLPTKPSGPHEGPDPSPMEVDPAVPAPSSPILARQSTLPLGPSPPLATLELRRDRLGKLVLASAAALGSCSFGDLCIRHRGPSCLTGTAIAPHPAIPILQRLRDDGAVVHRSAPDWTLEQRDAAVLRGAHQSTRTNSSFVREEFADMVESGQWLVLPYALVRHLSGLCLSPTGLVPQRDRRDRLIVDYTFSGVNQTTVPAAPDSLQFGYAFLRILQCLHRADTRRGPIYIAKIDVADAFMRIPGGESAILVRGNRNHCRHH